VVLEKGKKWGINKRPVAARENVSAFTGRKVSSMPVRKIEKPRTPAEVRKADMKGYPSQKETKSMPQRVPKTPAKPVAREKEKGKPEVQREMRERPAIQPKESEGRPPAKQKETVRPLKGVTEKPATTPDGIVRIPEQKRKLAKSPAAKSIKEQPTVIPRAKTGELYVKQQKEGKIRPQKELSDRPTIKSKGADEKKSHAKEQAQKQGKKMKLPEG